MVLMNVTITIDSNIREQKDVDVPGTGEIAETYLRLQYMLNNWGLGLGYTLDWGWAIWQKYIMIF